MSLFDDDDNDAMDEVEAKEAALNAPEAPDPRANAELLAHHKFEQQLLNWWSTNTMPHTIVLAGAKGIGKATLAFRLARFLFKPVGDILAGCLHNGQSQGTYFQTSHQPHRRCHTLSCRGPIEGRDIGEGSIP